MVWCTDVPSGFAPHHNRVEILVKKNCFLFAYLRELKLSFVRVVLNVANDIVQRLDKVVISNFSIIILAFFLP